MRDVPQMVTTISFSVAVSNLLTGRRFGLASSLNRHIQKCSQKMYPRMDVVSEKSQSVFSTPALATRDLSYGAARAVGSGTAFPVHRSSSIYHLLSFLTVCQLQDAFVPRYLEVSGVFPGVHSTSQSLGYQQSSRAIITLTCSWHGELLPHIPCSRLVNVAENPWPSDETD